MFWRSVTLCIITCRLPLGYKNVRWRLYWTEMTVHILLSSKPRSTSEESCLLYFHAQHFSNSQKSHILVSRNRHLEQWRRLLVSIIYSCINWRDLRVISRYSQIPLLSPCRGWASRRVRTSPRQWTYLKGRTLGWEPSLACCEAQRHMQRLNRRAPIEGETEAWLPWAQCWWEGSCKE